MMFLKRGLFSTRASDKLDDEEEIRFHQVRSVDTETTWLDEESEGEYDDFFFDYYITDDDSCSWDDDSYYDDESIESDDEEEEYHQQRRSPRPGTAAEGARDTGIVATIQESAKQVANKIDVSGKRATPSKGNAARKNGPPAPSGLGLKRSEIRVISKIVDGALLESSKRSSSTVDSEKRDSDRARTCTASTDAVDSEIESIHPVVSKKNLSNDRKGLPPPSRLDLRRSPSMKPDESSVGQASSRSASWSRRDSEKDDSEKDNVSVDVTESDDASFKSVARESKQSDMDVDLGPLLKKSSSKTATDNVPIVSPISPILPRPGQFGLEDVKYNTNSSSRMHNRHSARYRKDTLPRRHFPHPTNATASSTASSPPITFHFEGLSFLDDKNSEQGRPPVHPGKPSSKDELYPTNKSGSLDSSVQNFVDTLTLDDEPVTKILPSKATEKRRTTSWFPSRPHRKMDTPDWQLIDDKASGAVEVRPPPTPRWSQACQLTNPFDHSTQKKESNQQQSSASPSKLERAPVIETDNTIADHPLVESPQLKPRRKSSVKSLLRKITKVAGGAPAARGSGLSAAAGLDDDKASSAVQVYPPPNPQSPNRWSETGQLTNRFDSPVLVKENNQQPKNAGPRGQLEPSPFFETDNRNVGRPFQNPENKFHGKEFTVESPQPKKRRKSPVKSLLRKITKVARGAPADRFQEKGRRVKNAPPHSPYADDTVTVTTDDDPCDYDD